MSDPFADLVAAMDTAMVVVTVAADGEAGGCLVGFHCQCGIDPAHYAVWLSVANRTHELATRATHLAVHRLTAADEALARRFGTETGDDVDKLAGLDWEPGPGGAPLLGALPGRLAGRIVQRTEGLGDHDLFLLAVEEAVAPPRPEPPLRLSAVTALDPGHDAEERR